MLWRADIETAQVHKFIPFTLNAVWENHGTIEDLAHISCHKQNIATSTVF